jgi:ABC-type Fe3+ transport system substrate-binding protein
MSIQQEVVPAFKAYYLKNYKVPIDVEWLDQGGATEDLRYILSRFEKNPKSAQIDVLWGGGEQPVFELKKLKLLEPYKISSKLRAEVPQGVAAMPAYDVEEYWHAVNFSSFGIFYNKKLLKKMRIEEPKKWENLGEPQFFDLLSNADPRRSSSHLTIYTVIIQKLGWKDGWALLTKLAANTQKFALSSTAPVKAVVSAEAVAALSVDYFALAKVGDLGAENLGFHLPVSQTIINADPIGVLKGAPNLVAAGRFIEFLMNSETQKLFVLPKGAKQGPQFSTLGRLSINKKTYLETQGQRVFELNPFDLKIPTFVLDREHATKMQFVLSDLMGAVLVDAHSELKSAARYLRSRKQMGELDKLVFPITDQEMHKLADKWNDQNFRNQTINTWIETVKKIYKNIRSGK